MDIQAAGSAETVTSATPTAPAIDLPRAAEHAYRILRKDILSGDLAAKTVLQELDLARTLGVSRTPIREALSRLRAEGLVVMERYRQHLVAEFSEADRAEVYEIRAMLEGNAAARACGALLPAQIARLEEICTLIEMELDRSAAAARPEFERLNREFHSTIWEAAGRPRSQRLLDSSLSLPFNSLGVYSRGLASSMRRACWYHREIVSAFKARDAQRAQTQMSAHVLSLITTDLRD